MQSCPFGTSQYERLSQKQHTNSKNTISMQFIIYIYMFICFVDIHFQETNMDVEVMVLIKSTFVDTNMTYDC